MKNRRKNREAFGEHSYWQSYSDMMAALLLVFVLIIAITLAITTFVLAGLEHSIANMAYFVLYALLVPGGASFALLWNLLWVTLGNLLGGAVLLGLPLWYAADAPQQRAP